MTEAHNLGLPFLESHLCISNPLDCVWVAMVLDVCVGWGGGGRVELCEGCVIGARELWKIWVSVGRLHVCSVEC